MSAWMSWAALAALLVIFELFTGTFYLLMIAVGLVAGAVAALAQLGPDLQMLSAAIVGAGATLALHKSKYGWRPRKDAAHDPNVNMDIGQSIQVPEWRAQGNGKFCARVMYRGAMWDVELLGESAAPGVFEISEIQGSRLIVKSDR